MPSRIDDRGSRPVRPSGPASAAAPATPSAPPTGGADSTRPAARTDSFTQAGAPAAPREDSGAVLDQHQQIRRRRAAASGDGPLIGGVADFVGGIGTEIGKVAGDVGHGVSQVADDVGHGLLRSQSRTANAELSEIGGSRLTKKMGDVVKEAQARARKKLGLSEETVDSVVKDVEKLMSRSLTDWSVTPFDAMQAADKLGKLKGPELGEALSKLRDSGKLQTLLENMPPDTRAQFMETVRDKGDAKAKAVVAGAVSKEMDQIRSGDIGPLKYLAPVPGLIDSAYRASALESRQKELQGLLGANTRDTVQELKASGDLTAVQRNLIQPPTEENRRALFSMIENLKHDPKTAAAFMNSLGEAVKDVSGEKDVQAAFVEGFELSAEAGKGGAKAGVKWSPAPMLKALEANGQQELAKFYRDVKDQFVQHAEDKWGWGKDEKKAYDQEQAKWANQYSSGKWKSGTDYEY